jgi:hypothetical protein
MFQKLIDFKLFRKRTKLKLTSKDAFSSCSGVDLYDFSLLRVEHYRGSQKENANAEDLNFS